MAQTSSDSFKTPYTKGDILSNFGHLYKVFKVGKRTTGSEPQKVIFYKRLFPRNKRDEVTCSVPVKNLDKTRIRDIHSKQQLKTLMDVLANAKVTVERKLNLNAGQETLYSDDVDEKARLLKKLWLEQETTTKSFSYSKRRLLTQLVHSFSEEVAYIFDISLKKAEKKIYSALEG